MGKWWGFYNIQVKIRWMNNDFKKDFFKIFDMLKNKEYFSFSKYADGEYAILTNQKIKNCDGWVFNPETDSIYRDELLYSFKFNQEGYYIGISCPCCVPKEHVEWMRSTVNVKKENLTWANIFVNGNYSNYLKYYVPEYQNHNIILIAHKDAKINNLPFSIEEHIKITDTAFKDNFNLIHTLPEKNYKNKLFLFAAGPLGNMLAARMWEKNKNNIYLDIGSTLNSYIVGNNRGYLKGAKTLNKICIW